MNTPQSLLRCYAIVCCMCCVLVVAARSRTQVAPPQLVPTYFLGRNPPSLTYFLPNETKLRVDLPPPVRGDLRFVAFAMDGTSFFVQRTNRGMPQGLERIDLKSMRREPIRGSEGMGELRSLIDDPATGRIFVTGSSLSLNTKGTFEIDPSAATLRVVSAPLEEPISSDGRRVVRRDGNKLSIVDLNGGPAQAIAGLSPDARCAWSPNGRWIGCISGGRLVLVDAHEPSKSRNLAVGLAVAWSPDSRFLLLQSDCPDVPYGGRLEVIDVESGNRTPVASAECIVNQRTFGWVDFGALR